MFQNPKFDLWDKKLIQHSLDKGKIIIPCFLLQFYERTETISLDSKFKFANHVMLSFLKNNILWRSELTSTSLVCHNAQINN